MRHNISCCHVAVVEYIHQRTGNRNIGRGDWQLYQKFKSMQPSRNTVRPFSAIITIDRIYDDIYSPPPIAVSTGWRARQRTYQLSRFSRCHVGDGIFPTWSILCHICLAGKVTRADETAIPTEQFACRRLFIDYEIKEEWTGARGTKNSPGIGETTIITNIG